MAIEIKNPINEKKLDAELISLINDPSTIKIVVSTDEKGRPFASRRDTLSVLEDGRLVYAEEFEGSYTNSNVLRAVWYDRSVGVTIIGTDGRAFQLLGRPVRFDFVGPLHKKFYLAQREKFGGDSEVSGVWIIEIDEIINDTPSFRRVEEDRIHPYFRHLDRSTILLKQN
jgi:hypothetical protein